MQLWVLTASTCLNMWNTLSTSAMQVGVFVTIVCHAAIGFLFYFFFFLHLLNISN